MVVSGERRRLVMVSGRWLVLVLLCGKRVGSVRTAVYWLYRLYRLAARLYVHSNTPK